MRHKNINHRESFLEKNGTSLLTFLLGVGTGVGLVYLINSEAGENAREWIREESRELADNAGRFVDETKKTVGDKAEEFSDEAKRLYGDAKEAVAEKYEDARSVIAEKANAVAEKANAVAEKASAAKLK